MVGDTIYKLLALSMTLGKIGDVYNDYYIYSNEKLMGYSVSLVMEIDELLDNGYTKDEITDLIMGTDYTNIDPELTGEEGEYLRKYSLKMLDVRYRLYMEDKKNSKELKKGSISQKKNLE